MSWCCKRLAEFNKALSLDDFPLQSHFVSAREKFMLKLSPWFDGKLHSPVRNGWYDCKECNARHYFKDGLWYRNQKSLRDGPMAITQLHWRGLVKAA